MIDWNIESRAHRCRACNRSFADREAYHTLLFSERQGYARLDVCQSCWQAQYSEGASDRKGFVSHWQGQYAAPAPAAPEPIARETAQTLLGKLTTCNDPQYRPACYILAVMLERKRLLKVRAQEWRDSQRVFIYEQPKSGELFVVIDPGLQLAQLDSVQRDVARLLEHGLPDPAPGPGTDAAAGASATMPDPQPPAVQQPPAPRDPAAIAAVTATDETAKPAVLEVAGAP